MYNWHDLRRNPKDLPTESMPLDITVEYNNSTEREICFFAHFKEPHEYRGIFFPEELNEVTLFTAYDFSYETDNYFYIVGDESVDVTNDIFDGKVIAWRYVDNTPYMG